MTELGTGTYDSGTGIDESGAETGTGDLVVVWMMVSLVLTGVVGPGEGGEYPKYSGQNGSSSGS